jgi:hypothetical protein
MPRQICIKLLTAVRFQGSQDNRTPGDLALRWLHAHKPVFEILETLIVFGCAAPHIDLHKASFEFARELPKNRRRTEVSVPYSGSTGAIGRHN